MDQEKKSSQSSHLSPDLSPGQSSHGQSSTDQSKEAPVYASVVDEFFAGLQSGQRMSRPAPEAVAVAVQALQRFAAENDSEESVRAVVETLGRACVACGRQNPKGNSYCAVCGVRLLDSPLGESDLLSAKSAAAPVSQPAAEPQGQHYYHHHYHHHYFADGEGAFHYGGQDSRGSPGQPREGVRSRAPLAGPSLSATSSNASALNVTSMSRAESAVRKFTQDWAQACNTRQLDDLAELYAVDALVMRPNAPAVRGAAAIREFFFAALDAGLGEIEFEPLRVELLADVAYEAGRCKMLVPGVQGKRREERGKYLIVLSRQAGGEWKAVADSWSSDLSLAEISSSSVQNSGSPMRSPRKSA